MPYFLIRPIILAENLVRCGALHALRYSIERNFYHLGTKRALRLKKSDMCKQVHYLHMSDFLIRHLVLQQEGWAWIADSLKVMNIVKEVQNDEYKPVFWPPEWYTVAYQQSVMCTRKSVLGFHAGHDKLSTCRI